MSDRDANAAAALPAAVVRHGLPPGSRRYLAVLFAAPGARGALGAVYAFEAELRRILALASHEAAHARLQWWRAELDRLAAGRPTHPIARALQASEALAKSDADLLQECMVAADLDLARFRYRNWAELEAYCHRASGSLQTLIATVLAGRRPLSPSEREFAGRLGSAVRQSEMLGDLPQDLRLGRVYAPRAVLEELGIDVATLDQGESRSPAGAFLGSWRARVRDDLHGLRAVLGSPSERSDQRHGLVLAALYARMLERPLVPNRQPRRRVDLEPLGRLWTAWRTALRTG